MRLRTLIISLVLALGVGGAAIAASKRVTLHNTKTFQLKAGDTETFKVAYPDALKYGNSKYSGKVQILPPKKNAHGKMPSLKKVHVLSKGSAEGGSVFAVKVENTNKEGTAPVRVRVTATTQLPPGKKK